MRMANVRRMVAVGRGPEERAPQARTRFARGTQRMPTMKARPAEDMQVEQVAQLVHDIRNPLSTMALETRVLQETIEQASREELERTLGRFQERIQFVDRMLQALIDLPALAAAQLELCMETTELRAFVEGVIERAAPLRDRMRVFLDASAPVTTRIDRLQIERVITNLIGNALKFAPAASGIVVRIAHEDSACIVSVIDPGPGISAEEVNFIFDKYRRGAGAKNKPGLGLGLYISRKIVEAHGGTIGVESSRERGTRFYFVLPVQNS